MIKKIIVLVILLSSTLVGCYPTPCRSETGIYEVMEHQIIDYGVNVVYEVEDSFVSEFIKDEYIFKCDESSRVIIEYIVFEGGSKSEKGKYLYLSRDDYKEFFEIRYAMELEE